MQWNITCLIDYDNDVKVNLILKLLTFVDVDECSSNPCQNGGSCTDAVNSYSCSCVAGYTGTTCETGILWCSPKTSVLLISDIISWLAFTAADWCNILMNNYLVFPEGTRYGQSYLQH